MSVPTILAIWKPKGPTSHDLVDAVRRITGERRVGHAGTLDPMAEGVLVIGIGREATRQLKEIVGQEKEYIARVRLGATSDTDDAEGAIEISNFKFQISNSDIEQVLRQFIGHIQQVPPMYSAVKVRGKPAHRRVRKGEEIVLKPRMVEIKQIELLDYTPLRVGKHRQVFSPEIDAGGKTSGVDRKTPDVEEPASGVETPADVEELEGGTLTLRVVCGPGTYIRALARDIGGVLGTGGYLTELTRTRVGTYTKTTALTIEQFRERWPQIAATQ